MRSLKPPKPPRNRSKSALASAVRVGVAVSGGGVSPSTVLPVQDGTAALGTDAGYARGNHVHPTDTSRAPLASPAFTGAPTAPTPPAGDTSTRIATMAALSAALTSAGAGFVGASIHGLQDASHPQQQIPSAVQTTVQLASVLFDTNGGWDSANNRYVVPAGLGGKWLVTGFAGMDFSGGSPTDVYVFLRKNGTTNVAEFFRAYGAGAGVNGGGASTIVDLADGDSVQLSVLFRSGPANAGMDGNNARLELVKLPGSASWSPIDAYTVGYWPLNEVSASDPAADYARNMTLPGTASPGVGTGVGSGNNRRCRTFNGTSQWFYGGSTLNTKEAAAAGNGDWTVECWVNRSGTTNVVPFKLCKDVQNTSGGFGWVILGSSGMQFVEWLYPRGLTSPTVVDTTQTAGAAITAGTWFCAAIRKTVQSDGTATLDFFLNGALQQTFSGLHNCDVDGTASIYINQWETASAPGGACSLQMLRYSRKARTNAEILAFYNNSPSLG